MVKIVIMSEQTSDINPILTSEAEFCTFFLTVHFQPWLDLAAYLTNKRKNCSETATFYNCI